MNLIKAQRERSKIKRDLINEASKTMANVIADMGRDEKKNALTLAIEEHGKSLIALDGIVGILVKHGADPNIAARLGVRYWARGWEKRLEDALRSRWKFTQEDLDALNKAISERLESL